MNVVLNKKEQKIISELIKNGNKYVTSGFIARNVDLSDKTVRTYLKNISKILLENGACLTSIKGHGYSFIIKDHLRFSKFVNNQFNDYKINDNLRLDESENRQYYILKKLLLQQDSVLFEELMDKLFISRSTLSHEFSKIRKVLASYNLEISSKANKGVYVVGKERDKRHFILDYFFKDNYVNMINNYIGNKDFFVDISFEEITLIVLNECQKAKIYLSDYIIENLVLHIALAIKRIKAGKCLKKINIINSEKELKVAKDIIREITKITKVIFPEEEAAYIAIHLKSKASFQDEKKNDYEHDEIARELMTVLKKMARDIGYPYHKDKQLINGLLTHFYPLLQRLNYNIRLDNPLLDEIKSNYADTLELTKNYLSKMPVLKKYDISESEWGYLSLYFLATYERYKNKKKTNVLIVCSTGYGSAQMLKSRIEKEFFEEINVKAAVGYFEINDEILTDIDLIISTIDLKNLILNIPIITASVFLKDEDIKNIKNFIETKTLSGYIDNKNINRVEKEIIFNKYFDKKRFIVYNDTTKKELVLDKMLDILSSEEVDSYKEIMLKQIQQREKLSTVVFSEDSAVPHPAKAVGNVGKCALAIIKKGLNWNDKFSNIKFVFLLSPSIYNNKDLKLVTKAIVELIDNEQDKRNILKSCDYDDFKRIFIENM